MTQIKEDVFWDEYKPITNHLDDNASWNGCMFETYGNEEEFISQQAEKNPKKVWTIVDADGELIIVAGWHFVNRMGYLVTEKEWESEEDEIEED